MWTGDYNFRGECLSTEEFEDNLGCCRAESMQIIDVRARLNGAYLIKNLRSDIFRLLIPSRSAIAKANFE